MMMTDAGCSMHCTSLSRAGLSGMHVMRRLEHSEHLDAFCHQSAHCAFLRPPQAMHDMYMTPKWTCIIAVSTLMRLSSISTLFILKKASSAALSESNPMKA